MSIEDFMRMMQEQLKANAKNINENIQKSNDKLEREIKKELSAINKKVEEVTEETGRLKIKVMEDKKETDERFARIESKLDEIVEIGTKKEAVKRKHDTMTKERITPVVIQPTGNSYAERAATRDNEDKIKSPAYKSSYALHLSQKSLEQQLKAVSEAAVRLEGEDIEVTPRGRTKKKLLLGNSVELHEKEDWDWNEGETEWDGTENRQEKNREKKEKEKLKRKERIEKAAFIGRCTVGLGPIKEQSFKYFNRITGDFNDAKKMAAAEYLTGYLKFNHDDMSDMDICDTKVSPKGDDILYVVFDCPEKALNVRRRIADCQDPRIKTRDYIPPQFFLRYTALSRYARDLRSGNNKLKTQIRFGLNDISLYTKTKGQDEPFQEEDMDYIVKTFKLPDIEANASWKRKSDFPTWRKASPEIREVNLRSLGEPARGKSTSSERQPKRKASKNSAESSTSGSSSDSSNSDSPAKGKSTPMMTE